MNKKVFCISYDLHKGQNEYKDLYDGIRSFGLWWHQTESVWFIASDKDAKDIREFLRQYIDDDDKLFVIVVGGNWAGMGFTNEEYNWLRNNL